MDAELCLSLSKPEVGDMRASGMVNQDVARFDLPVYHSASVSMGKCACDFSTKFRS